MPAQNTTYHLISWPQLLLECFQARSFVEQLAPEKWKAAHYGRKLLGPLAALANDLDFWAAVSFSVNMGKIIPTSSKLLGSNAMTHVECSSECLWTAAGIFFLVCGEHGPKQSFHPTARNGGPRLGWYLMPRALALPNHSQEGAQPPHEIQLTSAAGKQSTHRCTPAIMQIPAISLRHHVVWLL